MKYKYSDPIYITYKEEQILSCNNCKEYLGYHNFSKKKVVKKVCRKCKLEQIHNFKNNEKAKQKRTYRKRKK